MGSEKKVIEITDTPYCYESGQNAAIQNIAGRVRELRRQGQLTPEVLNIIRSYFRIKNIYHSNAIEGNILDVGETRQVVEMGLTLTGKPLKDQAEAKNLAQAIDFLEELASSPNSPITAVDIRQIHTLVLKGIDDENAGKYRSVPVEISGSEYKPPLPESIPSQMEAFAEWLNRASVSAGGLGNPEGLLNAIVAHTWFVYIHPFIDGNGRVARLLMNLVLMRYGYPIAIITREDRLRYYDALEISQTSDLTPFISLVIECTHESLEEYEKAVKEQLERAEWAQSLASRFATKELTKAKNEYEVWKSAMDLLRSYFRQTAELLDQSTPARKLYFRDFGILEFEKYLSLRMGESAKKTWFFRIDFRSGERVARYLFFFGYPNYLLRDLTDVTLRVSREEPSGSFHYETLDQINAPNVPSLVEVGYEAKGEEFVIRDRQNTKKIGKIEAIGRHFFEEVINMHFQS